MLVRHLNDCEQFVAGDGSILRELLHPDKEDLHIRYSLAHAMVEAGRRTAPHKLKSSEVYYIITGRGLIHIDEESFEVGAGCAVNIPPLSMQHIENTGDCDLVFLCIVDPAWRQEDEKVFGR
ncbi:MAG: cupin domain-containing protein [Planctomycetota bacterium]|jgi:mannose-6-phosphate isomerase-like protein (cupin superfamily)